MRAESVGRKRVYGVFLISALVWALVLASPAQAQQSFTPANVEELISALEAANAEPDTPATITLVQDRTYTLREAHNNANGPNGLPVVTSEVTIEGNGATIARWAFRFTPEFRILHISGSGDLTLEDVTVRGGDISSVGGGIFNQQGILTIMDSTVSGNTAGDSGGGLVNDFGNMTITDSAITNNTSLSAGQSGIISSFGGGGVSSSTTNTNLDDPANRTTIVNSTISGNSAPNGYGGGIDNRIGRTELIHNTITDNRASQDRGQGVASFGLSVARTVVSGSIISANDQSGPDAALALLGADTFESAGHNLIGTLGSDVNAFQDGVNGDQTGVTEPGLEPLADNGGPTKTHALRWGSPAVDAAENDSAPQTDQRGVQRPWGAGPDIGSFELEQGASPPAPAVGLDPQSVDFEGQRVDTTSDPETVTVTNTGDADLSVEDVNLSGNDADRFSIESQSCTDTPITPQDDCTVELTFSPESAGEKGATLGISSNAPGTPHEVALSGTGVAVNQPPEIEPIEAQQATEGEEFSLQVQATDPDGGDLSYEATGLPEGLSIDESTGVISGTPAEGAAANSPYTVEVTVSDGSDSAIQSFQLEVSEAEVVSLRAQPESLAFSEVQLGTDKTEPVTLTNNGNTSLNIEPSDLSIEGDNPDQFGVEADGSIALAPDESAELPVRFAPESAGEKTATLGVSYGENETANVALSGEGVPEPVGLFSAEPDSLGFGEVTVGDSKTEEVQLTNTGNAPLKLSSVEVTGQDSSEFSNTSDECSASTLTPDESCAVEVAFEPGSAGEKQATLSFESDAPSSPHEVALSGTGVAAPPPPPDDPSDTSLALTSGRNIINFGQSVGLSGRLVDEDGKSLSGKQVILERRYTNQQRFQRVGTRTTTNTGRFSASVNPPRNAVFRARFAGDAENSASAAATSLRVRVVTRLNLSRESVPVGQNVVIAGNVRPAKTSFVNLTIRRGGQVVVNRRVNLNAQSRYRFVYRAPARGNYLVQVRYAGDRDNLAGAASQRFGAVAAPRRGNQSSVQQSRTRIQIPMRNQIQSQQSNQTIRER